MEGEFSGARPMRRREVLNLFEGSLLALEKRKPVVSYPYVGSIWVAGGNSLARVV
jgi:hypothetical protein